MKKLQAIKGDNLRPWINYFQVKNGKVYSFNGLCGVVLPVAEVFGSDRIAEGEELYFSKAVWATTSLFNAKEIYRDGLNFWSHKKGRELPCRAMTPIEFEDKIGRFPDLNVVLWAKDAKVTAVPFIGFDVSVLSQVSEALGQKIFKCEFFGTEKAIRVLTAEMPDSFGLVMPCMVENY